MYDLVHARLVVALALHRCANAAVAHLLRAARVELSDGDGARRVAEAALDALLFARGFQVFARRRASRAAIAPVPAHGAALVCLSVGTAQERERKNAGQEDTATREHLGVGDVRRARERAVAWPHRSGLPSQVLQSSSYRMYSYEYQVGSYRYEYM